MSTIARVPSEFTKEKQQLMKKTTLRIQPKQISLWSMVNYCLPGKGKTLLWYRNMIHSIQLYEYIVMDMSVLLLRVARFMTGIMASSGMILNSSFGIVRRVKPQQTVK